MSPECLKAIKIEEHNKSEDETWLKFLHNSLIFLSIGVLQNTLGVGTPTTGQASLRDSPSLTVMVELDVELAKNCGDMTTIRRIIWKNTNK